MKTSAALLMGVVLVLAASESRAQTLERFLQEPPGAGLNHVPGKPVGQGFELLEFGVLSSLPVPDQSTKAWLASRIPGLDVAALRTVSESAADSVLQRASAAQASYLDVFTDPGLGRGNPELYYLSQGVLDRLDRKWVSGSLPINGVTKDGRPFHMQALVVGQASANILYDLAQFRFKEGENDLKITDNGHVAESVLGAGDIGLKGLSGCGCRGPFCGCAQIQRITKTGPAKARVKTSRGDQNADLILIHPK